VTVTPERYACRGLGAGRDGSLSDTTVREGSTAVEEARARLRRQLEETYGVEGAAILMDRPVGGWSDLVTNQTLDLKIDALRHELIGSVDRRLRAQTWITTTTLIAGLALAFTAGRIG
jgi:hypothetical protein